MYLAALVASLGGLALCDYKWRLAWWHDARRTALTLGVSLAVFVVWDVAGIRAGIFFRGDSPALSGLDLAPHFPVEELLFLTLLCYNALLLFRGAQCFLDARPVREGAPR